MWSPTHVQVTVYRARNLLVKGKSGTNDTYITIKLGDEKYQTSIKERTIKPDWMEECDLPLSDMNGVVHLNTYHRNLLGIDEFLGHADIPLEQFNIYERPRSRWYALRNKPGSKKAEKYRGEIEVKITFIVQSIPGSPASLGKSEKGFKRSSSIKTLAHSVGEKMRWPSKGSLTKSGSKPDLSSVNSDMGDQSPTVRKIDKRDMTRSHTILPTSYNNQHLQPTHDDDLDSNDDPKGHDPKGHDFDRWTNPLAPFRRKKKSRLSKMSLLSHSSLTLDDNKSPPSGDLDDEEKVTSLKDSSIHKALLAKSMFDLSTPSIEEFHKSTSNHLDESDQELETETPITSTPGKTQNKVKQHSQLAAAFGGEGHIEIQDKRSSETFNKHLSLDEHSNPTRIEFPQNGKVNNSHFQERGIDVEFTRPPENIFHESSFNTALESRLLPIQEVETNPEVKVKPPKPPRVSPQRNVQQEQEDVIGNDICNGRKLADVETADADMALVQRLDVLITKKSHENETQDESRCSSGSDSENEVSPVTSSDVSTERLTSSPTTPSSERRLDKQITPVREEETTPSQDEMVPKLETKSSGQDVTDSRDRLNERKDKYKRMKEVNRRHTLQYGRHNLARATAHDLHEGIAEYKRAQETPERALAEEVIQQFHEHSREDLIRLILDQRQQIHRKEQYNRDMEDYIDNLLVKVMEATPKILQHPHCRKSPSKTFQDFTNGVSEGTHHVQIPANSNKQHSGQPANHRSFNQLSSSPANQKSGQVSNRNNNNFNNSNNSQVINTSPAQFPLSNKTNTKKPFNPFKKLQQALK